MEKDILFEGKEKATSVYIKEFSPQGARLDITASGTVAGKVTGFIMTTHNALMKPGGTGSRSSVNRLQQRGVNLHMGKSYGQSHRPHSNHEARGGHDISNFFSKD